jgi:hypothetical protein
MSDLTRVAGDLLTPPDADADAACHAAIAKAQAGELLGPREISAIFRIKRSRFTVLNKQGAFDHLKIRPAVGPRCFSGVLVARYLAGEPVYVPTFGRRRGAAR